MERSKQSACLTQPATSNWARLGFGRKNRHSAFKRKGEVKEYSGACLVQGILPVVIEGLLRIAGGLHDESIVRAHPEGRATAHPGIRSDDLEALPADLWARSDQEWLLVNITVFFASGFALQIESGPWSKLRSFVPRGNMTIGVSRFFCVGNLELGPPPRRVHPNAVVD